MTSWLRIKNNSSENIMNNIPDLFQHLALPWTNLSFFLCFSLCFSLYSFILRPQECFFLSESCEVLILGSGCVYTRGFCRSLVSSVSLAQLAPFSIFLHFLISLQNRLSFLHLHQMNLNGQDLTTSAFCPINVFSYTLANFFMSSL